MDEYKIELSTIYFFLIAFSQNLSKGMVVFFGERV